MKNFEKLIDYDLDSPDLKNLIKLIYFTLLNQDKAYAYKLVNEYITSYVNNSDVKADDILRSISYIIYYDLNYGLEINKYCSCENLFKKILNNVDKLELLKRSLTIISIYEPRVFYKVSNTLMTLLDTSIFPPLEAGLPAFSNVIETLNKIKRFLEEKRLEGLEAFMEFLGDDEINRHIALSILIYLLSLLYENGIKFEISYDENEPYFWVSIIGGDSEKLYQIENKVWEFFKGNEKEFYAVIGMVVNTKMIIDRLAKDLKGA